MFACLTGRLEVYLAMSSNRGWHCGIAATGDESWLALVSSLLHNLRVAWLVATDSVVDSLLEGWFCGEGLLNRGYVQRRRIYRRKGHAEIEGKGILPCKMEER